MKRLLNTLYITTQGAYVSRDGDTVLVRVDGETRLQVPIRTLSSIVCFGNVLCTPPLMQLCGEHDVHLSFLSERGRYYARIQSPVSGNVLLRREQYRRADDPESSCILARSFVIGKIANARSVLMRAARDHDVTEQLSVTVHRLANHIRELMDVPSIDRVRGLEGSAANDYFRVFPDLIVAQREDFPFDGRNRRPPTDRMNALLSFLYALVSSDTTAACESVGLDPQVGFLHRDRSGRPSLALDLMEELRPYIADRLALSLVNRKQVNSKGFRITETGAVHMDETTRKTVLVAYQERKQEEIQHPYLGESIAVGLLPHVQAMLLSRHLRGDIDGYPPFLVH